MLKKKSKFLIVIGGAVVLTSSLGYLKYESNLNEVKATNEDLLSAQILNKTSSEIQSPTTIEDSKPSITPSVTEASPVVNEIVKSAYAETSSIATETLPLTESIKSEILKDIEKSDDLLKFKAENQMTEGVFKQVLAEKEELQYKEKTYLKKIKELETSLKTYETSAKEQDKLIAKLQLAKDNKSNNAGNTKGGICISYGPMNIETRKKFETLLKNNNVTNTGKNPSYTSFQLPQYEIYWALGKNKLEAVSTFEAQKKEGALKDDKFRLTLDNEGAWIVPFTTIAGDYNIAENLAQGLNESSSKVGGKWQIREKIGGYYISFPNASYIEDKILLKIDNDLRLNKTFCQ